MRSRHADTFNHDADAPDYDADVRDESQPMRAGYAALLEWVVRRADVGPTHWVLELGVGTGNLTQHLTSAGRVVAVDVSARMLEVARAKVAGRIQWLQDDLLGCFDRDLGAFDRIVSTFAIHHLVEEEKIELFRQIRRVANPGARAVFGDLMFASVSDREAAIERYRTAHPNVADAIEHEFFWLVDRATHALLNVGFTVETRRCSELSWGIVATLDP